MYLYISAKDKDRLQRMAQDMGVLVVYHTHWDEHIHLIRNQDGEQIVESVVPDTFFVDMMEKMTHRIKKLEEAVGLL